MLQLLIIMVYVILEKLEKKDKMKLELHPKTNIQITHRYNTLEIELEDADYRLTQNIIESILEQDGVETLGNVLSMEDLTQLFLDRREDFEEIFEKYMREKN